MSHAKGYRAGVAAIVLSGAIVAACSAVGDNASGFLADGSNEDGGRPAPSTGNDKQPEGGNAGAAVGLTPTDNAIIVVHAAGAEAFRLCFSNDLDAQPTPTADLMPQANVVGVEVGSAIRLGPMATPPGDVYYVPESLVRNDIETCRDLVKLPYPVKMQSITDDLSSGVHLLVVSGCQAEPSDDPTRYGGPSCGNGYDPSRGNLKITHIPLQPKYRAPGTLPLDIVQLSEGVDALHSAGGELTVTFGDLGGGGKALATALDPPYGSVTTFGDPSFDGADAGLAIYGQLGFNVTVGSTTIATQSLADVQALSSPHDVPPTYYAAGSNYALLLLGSPASYLDAGDKDARDQVHFLAVPVVSPKPDGGADDGGADDGGDAGP